MKKQHFLWTILLVALCVALLAMPAAAAEGVATGGTCGAGLGWTLGDDGTLTIFGSGAMSNYNSSNAPWVESRELITRIVIEDSVTTIGNYAFYGCINATSVQFGTGVVTIGEYAFYNCTALTEVVVPENVATIGRGAFRGCKTAVLLTLGTGVGGGVILNGKMFSGGCGRGVELGHMQIVSGGEKCTCGVRGCIEAYCSATALIRDAVRVIEANPACGLSKACGGNTAKVDAKLVIDCAKAGDADAKAVFDAFVDHLAAACVSVVHLLDPEVIAIGGGVSHAGEFLFAPLREKCLEKCFFSSCGRIVPAELGNDAGMIGAALLQ